MGRAHPYPQASFPTAVRGSEAPWEDMNPSRNHLLLEATPGLFGRFSRVLEPLPTPVHGGREISFRCILRARLPPPHGGWRWWAVPGLGPSPRPWVRACGAAAAGWGADAVFCHCRQREAAGGRAAPRGCRGRRRGFTALHGEVPRMPTAVAAGFRRLR